MNSMTPTAENQILIVWQISLPENGALASEEACGTMKGAQVHVNMGDREGWRLGTHTYLTNIYCAGQCGGCSVQCRWVLPPGTYIVVGKAKIKLLFMLLKMTVVLSAVKVFRVLCECITT